MNISDLHIDGFGHWTDLRLEQLEPGFSVLYGPNEAGKTTLMQFVRTLLYGFSPDRRLRYTPPVHGGRPGGEMTIDGPEGRFNLSRYLHPEDGVNSLGRLQVTAPDGARMPERTVAGLLGHIDEATFNHVFAVGMRELQELGTLGDTAAADLLYKLAAGLDRVSLVDVVTELDASRTRLIGAGPQPSIIPQLVAQRDQLRGSIAQLSAAADQYGVLVRRRDELGREITQLEARRGELERRSMLIEMASGLREKWRLRAGLRAQLDGLAGLPGLEAGIVDRVAGLSSQIKASREVVAARRAGRAKLFGELRKLGAARGMTRHAAQIEVLSDQRNWITGVEKDIQQLQTELAELQAKRVTLAPVREVRIDANIPAAIAHLHDEGYASLRKASRDVRTRRQRLRQAKTLHRQHRQATEAAKLTLTSQATVPQGDLRRALEEAGTRVTQLRKRLQIEERLAQFSRQRREIEDTNYEMYDRQLLPSWVLMGLGALFVFGLAVVLAGIVLPKQVTGSIGWGLALLGFGGVAVAGMVKYFLEQNAEQDYDQWHKQKRTLHQQIRQIEEERDQLDRHLPRGGGPLTTRLQEAERHLAELEARVPEEAQKRIEKIDTETPVRALREAGTQYKLARERWQQGLRTAGLGPKTTPRQLRLWVAQHRGLRQHIDQQPTMTLAAIEEQHERRRRELAERQAALATVTQRIIELSGQLGQPLVGMAPVAQIDRLRSSLEDHQKLEVQRNELRKRMSELRGDLMRERRQLRDLLRQRAELFRGLPVVDEDALRVLAAKLTDRDHLRRQHDTLHNEIQAALLGRCGEEDIEPLLEQSPTLHLDHEWETCTARLEECRQQLHHCLETRGAISQQLKGLADDRQLAYKQLELGIVDQRLKEALDQWRVVTVTSGLVDRVRCLYERDRQPESLASASKYLQQLTEGKYTRVWTPFGQRTLRVDDAEGHTLPVEVLSRGTRELLFLSLRMSLAEMYRRRGVELPLVLDDLFVNFDGRRARAAAGVLREFSERGHQILMFTCHEHLVKLFRSLKVTVRDLPTAGIREEAPVEPLEPPAPIQPAPLPVLSEPERPKLRRRRRVAPPEPVARPMAVVEDDGEVDLPEWRLEAAPWRQPLPPRPQPQPQVVRPARVEPPRPPARYVTLDSMENPWAGAWLVQQRYDDEPVVVAAEYDRPSDLDWQETQWVENDEEPSFEELSTAGAGERGVYQRRYDREHRVQPRRRRRQGAAEGETARQYVRRFYGANTAEEFHGEFNERTVRRVDQFDDQFEGGQSDVA